MDRDADGGAELLTIMVVADQAEPLPAKVTALHDTAGPERWGSTPSAQNSLQV
jgi:hypothetical protein